MDYAALASKWADTSGETTEVKLATINALTVSGPDRLVPIPDAVAVLRESLEWYAIRSSAVSSTPNPGAAAAIDLWQDQRAQTIDMNAVVSTQMLGALVQGGLISQATHDALLALKATTQPWWQANGFFAPIGTADLTLAGIEA